MIYLKVFLVSQIGTKILELLAKWKTKHKCNPKKYAYTKEYKENKLNKQKNMAVFYY